MGVKQRQPNARQRQNRQQYTQQYRLQQRQRFQQQGAQQGGQQQPQGGQQQGGQQPASPLSIRVKAVSSAGKPVNGAVVTAVRLDTNVPFAHGQTGQNGKWTKDLTQNEYAQLFRPNQRVTVLFQAWENSGATGAVSRQIRDSDNRVNVEIDLQDLTQQGSWDPGKIDEALDAISGVSSHLQSIGTASQRRSAGPLDGVIDSTMLQVLGTRVRPEHPGELRAALDRAFALKEVDGRTVVDFRGTSGTASLPIEPGYVTSGPQAVLYKNAQSRVVSVRQALAELSADDDDQQDEFEAVRDIVDTKIAELVGLLGQDVRPPITRVNALFTSLIGDNQQQFGTSLLGELKNLVGFKGKITRFVDSTDSTRDDDRATTRFLEVYFYVRNLQSDWNTISPRLGPQNAKPLGTQLELVGLYLNRVAELRDDLDVALTGASVDTAERDFLWVKKNPDTSMAELMDWLNDFARTGKRFDSRQGIDAIQAEAINLHLLVNSGINLIVQGKAQQGLKNRQVRKALEALRDVLDGFKQL